MTPSILTFFSNRPEKQGIVDTGRRLCLREVAHTLGDKRALVQRSASDTVYRYGSLIHLLMNAETVECDTT